MGCLNCNWKGHQKLWLRRPYDGHLTETSLNVFFWKRLFQNQNFDPKLSTWAALAATSCT